MKKALALLGMGVIAIFAMGADDSCSVEDAPPPAKHANQGKATNGGAPTPAEPEMTPSQENAVQTAEDYLAFSAFSKAGLIQQLSSSAGSGFPKADAVFAVNYLDVNWNQQAYKAAKDYLEFSSFSLDGLIQQLASSAGSQFTQAQAEYGAKKAYSE